MKFNERTLQNIHKLRFIAGQYKERNMVVLSQMFQIPPIEFNAAAWGAVDLGYLKINDDNTFELLKEPEEYKFGELVDHLMDIIPYTVAKVNEKEAVLEEGYFQNWTAGFPQQDVICATKKLVADEKLSILEIVDKDVVPLNREERRKPENKKIGKTEEVIESTYYFYTLPENADKDWHEKQFKDAKKLQKQQREQSQAK